MMAHANILLDLDGTLCDPGPGITDSVDYALQKMGIVESDPAALRRFVGPPLEHSFRDLYHLDDKQTEQAVGYYRERFSERGIHEAVVYEGIPELLGELATAKRTLVVATSKPLIYSKQILQNVGIINYFAHVEARGLDEVITKSVTVERAMKALNILPETAVMIGDRQHDIIGARDNGLDSIGVLYGYGDREELASHGATEIVGTVAELRELLLN
jgi:phosphoglycolate phosphatase